MNRMPTVDDVIRIGDKEVLVIDTDSNWPPAAISVVPFVNNQTGTGSIPISAKNTVSYSVDYPSLELQCTVGAKHTRYKLSDVAFLGRATCTKTINVVKFKAV